MSVLPTDRQKEFILQQVKALANYDALRPAGHVYEFHLHSERVAQSTKSLALAMGYDRDMSEALYWATLVHDIGKTTLPVSIWDLKNKPTNDQKSMRRTHTTKGVETIRKEFGEECDTSPFLQMMMDIMENHHEMLDGTGFFGKTAKDLSREVRMVCICDAFDGWSVKREHFGNRDLSPAAVIERMETEKAGQFDENLLSLFKKKLKV